MTQSQIIQASFTDVMLDGMGAAIDMHLHAVIDLSERLNLELLRKSLYTLYLQEPLVGGRYLRKPKKCEWQIDPDPEWTIKEYSASNNRESQSILDQLIPKPISHVNELPVELHLIHLPENDSLIVRINHLLADGGGIKNLIYQIAENYSRLSSDPQWVPKKNPSLRSYKRLVKVIRFSNIGKIVYGFIRDVLSLKSGPTLFVPMNITEKPVGGTLGILHISKERVLRLKEKWKNQSITINDIFLASISRALYFCFSSIPKQHNKIGFTVSSDLRQYLPPEKHICNISSIRVFLFDAPLNYSPEKYLTHVLSKTSSWKKMGAGLGGGFLPLILNPLLSHNSIRKLFKKEITGGREKVCNIAFTNIGIIEEKKLLFGKTTCTNAFITPPISFSPTLVMTATGCNGSVTFSFGYWKSAMTKDSADKIIKELDKQLCSLE